MILNINPQKDRAYLNILKKCSKDINKLRTENNYQEKPHYKKFHLSLQ